MGQKSEFNGSLCCSLREGAGGLQLQCGEEKDVTVLHEVTKEERGKVTLAGTAAVSHTGRMQTAG